MNKNTFPITTQNKIIRGKKKASYDKEVVYAILDAAEICHIAFIYDGEAFVQPINFGRSENKIYLHGSHKNRMTEALLTTKKVCLNVMLLDAMKLTRSAFHHSVNYRSVMIFGSVKELTTKDEKLIGLQNIINHFVPNRWENCRKPNDKELNATRVLEIEIETASAKIADAPATENKEDLALDFWAGIIPVKTICKAPIPDVLLDSNCSIPEHIVAFYEQRKE